MSSFIISLDSVYRDAFLYPNPGSYDIIINPFTPGSLNNEFASNTTYVVDNPVFTSFQWTGNASFPTATILGYPTSIPLNARVGRASQFFSLTTFSLDDGDQMKTVDYYVGCIFFLFVPTEDNQTLGSATEYDYETGIISVYDPVANKITLQTRMDLDFLTRVFTATQEHQSFNNYYIINTSFTLGNNLILLGINSFLSDSDQNYVSDISFQKAPTTDMWVQNITKGWLTSMYYLDTTNRNAFLEAVNHDFTLDLNDVFVLRGNDNIFDVQTTGPILKSMLDDTVILSLGSGYATGTIYTVYIKEDSNLTDNGLSLQITSVDSVGGIVTYEWVTFNTAWLGTVLQVGNVTPTPALLKVVSVTPLAIPISVADGKRVERYSRDTLFTVYIPVQGQPIFQSFGQYQKVVYTSGQNATAYMCISQYTGKTATIPIGTFIQLVSYSSRLVGVVAPVVGYQQGVCYKVRLLSLTLPNQPVKGYNQLPSFFPYFMLQLYNTNFITGSTNIIYTNHPATQKVTFFCPMGNPRNQLVSTYVVVRSTQENFIKWTSVGSIHIEVLLPNGAPLVYTETAKVTEMIIESNALGLTYQSFIITLMNQTFEPHIVATFEFQIMT